MRKIIPNFAIIYFLIMLSCIISILFIVDNLMPQYSFYKRDNEVILDDEYQKRNKFASDYRLLKYDTTTFVQDPIKILVMGDSYVEGDGYANINDTWWKCLQKELYDRGYYNVEIIAAGMNGASTYDEYMWLSNTSMVEDIEPDLIIIGYVLNDPELDDEDAVPTISAQNFLYKNCIANEFSLIYPNIIYKLNNLLESKYNNTTVFDDTTGYPSAQWELKIIDDYHIQRYYEKALVPLSNYITTNDIPIFIGITTTSVSDATISIYNTITRSLDLADLDYYNMISDLKEYIYEFYDSSNTRINPVNSHPGTYYTKYFARYFADILETDYQQYLGQKYEEQQELPININDWLPYEMMPTVIDETDEYIEYSISSTTDDKKLYMPIKDYYVKLSLEFPVTLSKIEIENSDEVEVYVTLLDEDKGYDTGNMYELKNKDNVFKIESDILVSTINISGNLEDDAIIRLYK